jgi:hypothetical protein
MNITLEERIATALSSDTASDVVAILIAEVETAIVAADKAAKMEREKALDPLASPDAAKARASMEDAAFTRDRLRNVLPRLQARLTELQAAEYAAWWEPDFEQVEARRDEWARKYAQYPKIVAQLVDILRGAEEIDQECSRVNGSAPPGEHRRLRQVELVARGLDNFSRADPPITKAVQLPDWTNSEKMLWPPPNQSLAVQVATSMTYSSHPGANWWQESKERAQAMREEHARVIDHYDSMARAREEREAAEVRAVQERRAAE